MRTTKQQISNNTPSVTVYLSNIPQKVVKVDESPEPSVIRSQRKAICLRLTLTVEYRCKSYDME